MVFGGQVPEKIGRYEIVLQIARGGMATVYLSRAEGHGGFDRYVALKLTAEHLRDDPEFAQHLVEEAKLVAHLRHTNVVPVLDVGEDEMGAVFLVMEYVPGDSLGGLFRTAKKAGVTVPARVGLRVLVDALQGLHAAHEHADEDGKPHNLVHRDFSPQNILVGTDGIARLTDFGIAKATSRASITVAGTMKGKVSYAAPEQARGKTLDKRCDVWAAGVIAWEVLVGRKLFPSTERTLLDIVKGPPPRVRTEVPDIPQELDDAIAQALEMEAENRTPTAQAFARALSAAAQKAGMLAEVEEVAEHVKQAVAPILAERREKIAEARRVRGMLESAPEIDLDDTTGAVIMKPKAGGVTKKPELLTSTVPLPSLPDIPMVTRRLDNAATIPASVANDLMAQSGSNPYAIAPPPPSQHGGTSSERNSNFTPSATPSGTSRPNFTRSSFQSIVDLKATVADRVTHFIAKKPTLVIGGASAVTAVLLLTAVIVLVASGGPSKDEKAAAAAAWASASFAALTPSSPSAPSTTSRTTPRTSSLGDPEPLPPQLELAANAPISRVRIGKRWVELDVPAPKVAVDLAPDETSTTLSILVVSTDGHTSNATWNPGDSELSVTFDANSPAAPPAATPKKVGPKKPPKKK